MNRSKPFWKTLLSPPVWVILPLTVFSTAALVAVFANQMESHPIAYEVYGISFYTLCVDSVFCVMVLPKRYAQIRQRLSENELGNRYLTDAAFKTHVSLYLSLGINLVYVVTNAVSAYCEQTIWFAIYAVYYAVMALMRFLLARFLHQAGSRLAELKRSRLCAWMLMSVNLALSGAVLMMVHTGRGFAYPGYMIYVMALYTFWATVSAIRDLIRFRTYRSPVMSATKAVKLASSLMSMLALETAMFAQFGGDTPVKVQKAMIMATGGGIAVIVTAMSVYRILHDTKEIQKLQATS